MFFAAAVAIIRKSLLLESYCNIFFNSLRLGRVYYTERNTFAARLAEIKISSG